MDFQNPNISPLIFVAFMGIIVYFFMIRPQKKKQRERLQMLHALKKGDQVITIGGLHGLVFELTDELVTLKTADGHRMIFDRSAISTIQTPATMISPPRKDELPRVEPKNEV